MAPTLLSPNVDNYQIGKGVFSFKQDGYADFRDLGNVDSGVLTPNLTTLDHFSSRLGVKSKDKVITLEKSAQFKISMDEITAHNIALMVLGTVDEYAEGGPTIEIFNNNSVNGWLRFVGANEVGAQIQMDLYNVSFTPSGDFSLISDEWNKMETTAEVLVAGTASAVSATGKLTATDVIADTETVTIGATVYTFQDTLTAGAGHVKIGADLAASLVNLAKAINLTGISGTDYGAGTVIHPTVSAKANPSSLIVTAKTGGTAGNAIASTATTGDATWGAATLEGGLAADAANSGKFGIIQLLNVAPLT
jgi:hypothetical protein